MLTENVYELMRVIEAQRISGPNPVEIQRLRKKIEQGKAVVKKIEQLRLSLMALGLPKEECGALVYPIIERLTTIKKKKGVTD